MGLILGSSALAQWIAELSLLYCDTEQQANKHARLEAFPQSTAVGLDHDALPRKILRRFAVCLKEHELHFAPAIRIGPD